MKTNQRCTTPAARVRATLFMAVGLALAAAAPLSAHAQAPAAGANGISRTDVVRHDVDAQTEAIQVRVDFAQHASFPRHSHPGVEIAYVLEGTMEYELDGKPVTLSAGQALYIPAGAVHAAKNAGSGKASELATYLVVKGKPIVVLAK